jgi:hypothetical protein
MRNIRKKNAKAKLVGKLTEAELDKMSAEFDCEFVADTFGPPTPEAKAKLRSAKRKRGRPQVGAGAKAISVTVEKTLLTQIDRVAKLRKTTRAKLINRGLQAVLQEEEAASR